MQTLKDLFVYTLQDVYYAEQQIVGALSTMVDKVQSPELRNVLKSHLTETQKQIERLDEILEGEGVEQNLFDMDGTFCAEQVLIIIDDFG